VSFRSGADERRIAIGSVAQQATQLLIALASLAVVTVLARELSFAGFGVYTLFVSFSTYLLFAQTAVEGAAFPCWPAPTRTTRPGHGCSARPSRPTRWPASSPAC